MLQRQTASRYELEALKQLREKPAQELIYTPNGTEYKQVDFGMQRWRERRIDYLDTRLRLASLTMTREFERQR